MSSVVVPKIKEMLNPSSPAETLRWMNILLYSEPGVGKTTFVGTAMDHEMTRPLLILDVDGGAITLRKRRDVDVIEIRTMKELQDIANNLEAANDGYYKTVAIDTMSELQKLDMKTVMKEQFEKNPETTDILVPSPREWGKSQDRMRDIIREFRDGEYNFIATCHLAEEKSDSGGRRVYAAIPGKLKNELAGFFDIVAYMKAVAEVSGGATTIHREMQLVNTETVSAKDRSDDLPPLMINPTIPDMWDILHP